MDVRSTNSGSRELPSMSSREGPINVNIDTDDVDEVMEAGRVFLLYHQTQRYHSASNISISHHMSHRLHDLTIILLNAVYGPMRVCEYQLRGSISCL